MERVITWMFVFVLLIGFGFAADDWEDVNDDDLVDIDDVVVTQVSDSVVDSQSGEFYTSNFYVALGIFVLVLVIVGIFVWLWIRGPKNKWEK
ncbi:hypothetical protein HN903_04535 [archaeon]|jgi:hypothetical protein|nr:hypothetical protein [archaeon]MBT7128995.1 hypothetical protein [archaeon]